MTAPMARVLVDACLLVKGNISNVFFDLGQSGLISLHWTPEIAGEFVKNWATKRTATDRYSSKTTPAKLYSKIISDNEAKARERLGDFELMQPEWRIPGWDFATASKRLPASRFKVGKSFGVDAKDYHVALAAARLADAFPNDDIWLATENLDDLPAEILSKFHVWSVHQGEALSELFHAEPHSVMGSLLNTLRDTKRPKLTKQDMIAIVASGSHFAAPELSIEIAAYWQKYDIARIRVQK